MPDLTFKDVFGENASYNASSTKITFFLTDVAGDSLNADPITEANCDRCASKMLWALLNHVKNIQPNTNNDPERGIYVSQQGSRRVTRGTVSQFAYQLVVAGYTPDPMTDNLAADDLVMDMGE